MENSLAEVSLSCRNIKGEPFASERMLTGWRNKGQLKLFLKSRMGGKCVLTGPAVGACHSGYGPGTVQSRAKYQWGVELINTD